MATSKASPGRLWAALRLTMVASGFAGLPAYAQPYGGPVPGLTPSELAQFQLGRDVFSAEFTLADGLGPLVSDTACNNCHSSPAVGGSSSLTLVYSGTEDGEAFLWPGSVVVSDPDNVPLCTPDIPPGAIERPHITPPVFGAGYVEAIPDALILANADPNDDNADSISGRVHLVTALEDPLGPPRVGRFGHKAQAATLPSVTAVMLRDVLGITNALLPTEFDPSLPPLCDTVPDPEDVPDAAGVDKLHRLSDFQRLLAAPPQWPPQGTMPGEAIFQQVGCAVCHVPTWTTGPSEYPALANRVFHPYGDWLLHDIGTGDGLSSGAASGKEMRTAPLWGLRHRSNYLHDGCVSFSSGSTLADLESVIAAHSCGATFGHCVGAAEGSQCEALPAYNAYAALTAGQKAQLLDFLGSLGRMRFDEYATGWPGTLDIDLSDWNYMQLCISAGGPGVSPEAVSGNPLLHDCLFGFDADLDGDTDLADGSAFQQTFGIDAF